MKKSVGIYLLAAFTLLSNSEAFAGRSKIWPVNEEVVAQSEAWTCGVHAGCTLMRSQGVNVSLNEVLRDCPNYNIFGFLIGPDPKKLATHMTDVCKRVGNQQVCYEAVKMADNTQDAAALETIRGELMAGPVIALTKTGVEQFPFVGAVVQLHNLLIYGFDEDKNEFYVYDTDKTKYTLSGQQLIDRWFWNTEDRTKPEYSPMVAGFLKNNHTFPKMYIRSQVKSVAPKKEDGKEDALTPEELADEELQKALRMSTLYDELD